MNDQLQQFARQTLKDGLAQLSDGQVDVFRRMYSHKHPKRTISEIVNSMPAEKLDWAMEQVRRTLDKVRHGTTEE